LIPVQEEYSSPRRFWIRYCVSQKWFVYAHYLVIAIIEVFHEQTLTIHSCLKPC
jgi:hypothetical protein